MEISYTLQVRDSMQLRLPGKDFQLHIKYQELRITSVCYFYLFSLFSSLVSNNIWVNWKYNIYQKQDFIYSLRTLEEMKLFLAMHM